MTNDVKYSKTPVDILYDIPVKTGSSPISVSAFATTDMFPKSTIFIMSEKFRGTTSDNITIGRYMSNNRTYAGDEKTSLHTRKVTLKSFLSLGSDIYSIYYVFYSHSPRAFSKTDRR